MSRLLYANLVRLKNDTSFRLTLVAMAAIGIFLPVNKYHLMQRHAGIHITLDNGFFTYIMMVVIFASAFCSLYIGTEYSDGTIRNKLMVGHTRANIYLSNFIVCVIGEIFMCLAFIVGFCAVGIPLLGFFSMPIKFILAYMGCSLMLCIAVAAIFTFVAMLNQNKAVTSVICILGMFVFVFGGAYMNARLKEPKRHEAYVYVDIDGEIVERPEEANPYYIDEPERSFLNFLNDFLTGNQTVTLSQIQAEESHLGLMMLYSAIIAVAVTGIGLFVFRREDVK